MDIILLLLISLLLLLVRYYCFPISGTVHYTNNDFTFIINLDTKESCLSEYSGDDTNVAIPEYVSYKRKKYKVTSLDDFCFKDSSSLVSIEIPSSVTSIGNWCFSGCSSLASVAIPSSVTNQGEGCFGWCSSLTSVVIPSSVTNIEGGCFVGCSNLETIIVDANNPCYDSREGCNAIIETESNTMIQGCKNTFIPSSVTGIGAGCFEDCNSLASIKIPSSVTSIGEWCFCGCDSLETVVVDANNPCYDSREGCNAIIETVSNTMIAGCKSTFIPFSVASLGNRCFGVSSLASIEIPSSVTSLGEQCFKGCSSLQTVICRMENAKSGNFFDDVPIKDATLYVPKPLLATYQSTKPWSSFGTILPLEGDKPTQKD